MLHNAIGDCCFGRDGTLVSWLRSPREVEEHIFNKLAALAAQGDSGELRDMQREAGNVLDHWEQLPNDLRTDPGFESLDKALQKLYRATLATRPTESKESPLEYIGKDGRRHWRVKHADSEDCGCGATIINEFEWQQHLKTEKAEPQPPYAAP